MEICLPTLKCFLTLCFLTLCFLFDVWVCSILTFYIITTFDILVHIYFLLMKCSNLLLSLNNGSNSLSISCFFTFYVSFKRHIQLKYLQIWRCKLMQKIDIYAVVIVKFISLNSWKCYQVYLLTVLKGLKHRLAAGNIIIYITISLHYACCTFW